MNRLMSAAVLVAAGALLLAPPQARAQETATYKCEFTAKYSLVTIQNTNKEKKSSVCRWKCIYQMRAGGTHINEGAKRLPYQGKKTNKRGVSGIQDLVGAAGYCP